MALAADPAGDSAGAHLSLGAALQWRASGAPALVGQLLYYGAYGLQDSASRRLYGWAELDGLGDEDTAQYRNAYFCRFEPRYEILKFCQCRLTASPFVYMVYS
jgi:acetyl esterase